MSDPVKPEQPEPVPTPKVAHRVAVALFFVLFWAPMLYRAAFHANPIPKMPRLLSDVQALSCLFSEKPNGWAFFYVQVQYPGRRSWDTVDQAELFPLEPFGHRTRLHRLLQAWDRKPGKRTDEVAAWFFKRWEQLHPDEVQPQFVRLSWSWIVPEAGNPPEGEWKIPPWHSLRADRRKVISVHERPE